MEGKFDKNTGAIQCILCMGGGKEKEPLPEKGLLWNHTD
jgi:hypothetical protein